MHVYTYYTCTLTYHVRKIYQNYSDGAFTSQQMYPSVGEKVERRTSVVNHAFPHTLPISSAFQGPVP